MYNKDESRKNPPAWVGKLGLPAWKCRTKASGSGGVPKAAARQPQARQQSPASHTRISEDANGWRVGFEKDEMVAFRQKPNAYGKGKHGPPEYSNEWILPAWKCDDEADARTNIKVEFPDGMVVDVPLTVYEWRLSNELHKAAAKEGRQIDTVWSGCSDDGLIQLRVRITPQSGRPPLVILENHETKNTITTITAWAEEPGEEATATMAKEILIEIGKSVIKRTTALADVKLVKMKKLKAIKKEKPAKRRPAAASATAKSSNLDDWFRAGVEDTEDTDDASVASPNSLDDAEEKSEDAKEDPYEDEKDEEEKKDLSDDETPLAQLRRPPAKAGELPPAKKRKHIWWSRKIQSGGQAPQSSQVDLTTSPEAGNVSSASQPKPTPKSPPPNVAKDGAATAPPPQSAAAAQEKAAAAFVLKPCLKRPPETAAPAGPQQTTVASSNEMKSSTEMKSSSEMKSSTKMKSSTAEKSGIPTEKKNSKGERTVSTTKGAKGVAWGTWSIYVRWLPRRVHHPVAELQRVRSNRMYT